MKNKLSRRTLLSGSAAALASMSMWKMLERRAFAADGVKRFIVWYVPEGATQQAFWPGSGPGALNINMNASINGEWVRSFGDKIADYRSNNMGTYCLQPLKDHEADISIMSGFRNQGAGSDDPHAQVVNTALCGTNNRGRSIDQIIGDYLKGDAAFASISTTLFGAHAHSSPNYLCPLRLASGGAGSPTWNPVTTYNQVFPSGIPAPGGGTPMEPVVNHSLNSKLALLGSVKQRLNQVKCNGGALAQERMEAYLTSIENIENQTQAILDAEEDAPPPPQEVDLRINIPAGWENTNNGNRYWEKSDNFGALCRIQIDTTIAALALDRTRCSFLQFSATGNDLGVKSGRYDGNHYRDVVSGLEGGAVLNDHNMGHDQDATESRNAARVYRWYYEQLAYLVERLKSIPDGTGTMFDSTLIFCASDFGMYNHRTNDLPYMIVGNPDGAFRTGQYFDAYNGGHRTHTDLLLAICQGMGMNMNSFADSSSPYSPILA